MDERTLGPAAGAADDERDRPVGATSDAPEWGSDAVAALLRALGVPYFALVPGSSFRGLHDSLVNHLGNRDPRLVVCLHEEHAVAIANGYARVTETPMAVGLHANVGLLHAAMTIYSTWCDRLPMLILGATGPVDAHQRRPWIDWVHTARDQGAVIRGYVKWDDQPASPEAAVEALLRASQIARTAPQGPTYVCMDVSWQEAPLSPDFRLPEVSRFPPPRPVAVAEPALSELVEGLGRARRPVFMFGRMSRSTADWAARVRLAEATGAAVVTSIHNAAAFPTDHAQHVLPVCGDARTQAERALFAASDLIVSFDWMDLAGFLRSLTDRAQTQEPVAPQVVQCTLEATVANGWSMDHQALPAADLSLAAHPDTLVAQLLDAVGPAAAQWNFSGPHWSEALPAAPAGDCGDAIALDDFAMAIRHFGMAHEVTFVRFPISWPAAASRFEHPLAYLGTDGGASIGVGPGQAVGAALALRGSGRIATAVLGDGDTLMGIGALWTASHLDLPLLVLVANNQSYFNDELHQERVARARGRPEENRWIGQRLDAPAIDICAMARAQGFEAEGPVCGHAALEAALDRAATQVRAGGRVLIDARIEPSYASELGRGRRQTKPY